MRAMLVGGLGDSRQSLLPLLKTLRERGLTAALLLPETRTFGDRVTEIHEEIDKSNEPFVLIGQSAGGLAALVAASQTNPAAVVAICPAPPRGITPLLHLPLLKNMWPYLWQMLLGKEFKPTAEHYIDIALNGVESQMFELLVSARQTISGREANELAMPWLQPRLQYENIRCPCLIIGALDDRWVRFQTVLRLYRRLAPQNMQTRFLAEVGGHMQLHQQHTRDRIMERICSFLSEV